MSTTSAVSMAASEPRAPMAIPDIGPGDDRGIVDAIADESNFFAGIGR